MDSTRCWVCMRTCHPLLQVWQLLVAASVQMDMLQDGASNTLHHTPGMLHQVQLNALDVHHWDALQVQSEATRVAVSVAEEADQAKHHCHCLVHCPQCHLVELLGFQPACKHGSTSHACFAVVFTPARLWRVLCLATARD